MEELHRYGKPTMGPDGDTHYGISIKITNAVISGTNLQLTFVNTDSSSHTLSCHWLFTTLK